MDLTTYEECLVNLPRLNIHLSAVIIFAKYSVWRTSCAKDRVNTAAALKQYIFQVDNPSNL